jgi:hypothetical protein
MDTPPSPEMDSTEEIDITDLVDMTKSIKRESGVWGSKSKK